MTGPPEPHKEARSLMTAAVACHQRGDLKRAANLCNRALELEPTAAAALNLLGVLHAQAGDPTTGAGCLTQASKLDPANPDYLTNLGLILRQAGDQKAAFEAVTAALKLPGAPATATHTLADLWLERGNGAAALQVLWERLQRADAGQDSWLKFTEMLRHSEFGSIGDVSPLLGMVEAIFNRPGLEYQSLTAPVRQMLWHIEALARLRELSESGDAEGFRTALFDSDVLEFLSRGVIGSVLVKCVLPDKPWELLLTRIRSTLLDVAVRETDTGHPVFLDPTLACGLAQQCWLNGFVFTRSSEEDVTCQRIAERLLGVDSNEDPADLLRLAVLACYGGLIDWRLDEHAVELAKLHPFTPFIDLLVLQVGEPLDEIEIAKQLETVGHITTGVSAEVRAQYEEHPYPRWVSIDIARPEPVAVRMSSLFPEFDFSDQANVEAPRALVAGCGTGRSLAIMATTVADVRITGIDLSRASLAYGARMMSELGFEDIDLYHADILSLADWEERFNIIECSGVLHHMDDPLAGWRVLEGLLEPGGLMKIALYSEAARTSVVAVRSFIAEKGMGSTPEEIRALRQRLLDGELPEKEMLRWRDFWILEEFRDLVFHVKEHRFSVPQVADCISELGLEFIGFESSPAVLARFRRHDPSPRAERSLASWQTFEEANPATFAGMYQFWLKKPVSDPAEPS